MTQHERVALRRKPTFDWCRLDFGYPLIFAMLVLAACAGCAAPGEPVERRPAVPQPVTDLAAQQFGNEAVLTFELPKETVEHKLISKAPTIEVFRAFRNPSANGAQSASQLSPSTLVLTVPPAMATHDTENGKIHVADVFEAGDLAKYAGWTAEYTVRTSLSRRKLSAPSNTADVRIYPAADPIEDLAARVTQQAVVLSWTPPASTPVGPSPPIAAYRIYRMESHAPAGSPESTAAATTPPKNPLAVFENKSEKKQPAFVQIAETSTPAYADAHFDFGATYVYSVRSVLQYSGGQIESADSNQVTVMPRDVFPPVPPQGLVVAYVPAQAGSAAYLDLSWAISTETGLVGYNVYRSEEVGAPGTRANTRLLLTPAFRDMNAEPGHKYFYTVTAVDRAGNESSPSAAASGEVPAESPQP